MPDLSIYTISDPDTLANAIRGVAMFFGMDSWVGGIVKTAMIVSLLFVLGHMIFNKGSMLPNLLIAYIVVSIGFFPKTTVVVEQFENNAPPVVVDNVPYIIAYPAALAGNFSLFMTEKIQTVMSTANQNYLRVTDGKTWMKPARILMCLLDFGRKSATIDINLMKTLEAGANNCGGAGDSNALLSTVKFSQEPNALDAFAQALGSAGVTIIYDKNNPLIPGAPSGRAASCQELKNYLSNLTSDSNSLADLAAPVFTCMQNQVADYKSQIDTLKSSPPPQVDDVVRTVSSLSRSTENFTAVSVVNFAYASILDGLRRGTSPMGQTLNFRRDTDQFDSAINEARLAMRWETNIALMDVLFFVFIASTPIVLFFCVANPQGGIKLAASYMTFGIWTQSWIPMLAIVTYWYQTNLDTLILQADRSALTSSFNSLSANNVMEMLRHVARISDVAASMMNYAPMITFAIMSGSMFALTTMINTLIRRDAGEKRPDDVLGSLGGSGSGAGGKAGLMEARRMLGVVQAQAAGALGVHDNSQTADVVENALGSAQWTVHGGSSSSFYGGVAEAGARRISQGRGNSARFGQDWRVQNSGSQGSRGSDEDFFSDGYGQDYRTATTISNRNSVASRQETYLSDDQNYRLMMGGNLGADVQARAKVPLGKGAVKGAAGGGAAGGGSAGGGADGGGADGGGNPIDMGGGRGLQVDASAGIKLGLGADWARITNSGAGYRDSLTNNRELGRENIRGGSYSERSGRDRRTGSGKAASTDNTGVIGTTGAIDKSVNSLVDDGYTIGGDYHNQGQFDSGAGSEQKINAKDVAIAAAAEMARRGGASTSKGQAMSKIMQAISPALASHPELMNKVFNFAGEFYDFARRQGVAPDLAAATGVAAALTRLSASTRDPNEKIALENAKDHMMSYAGIPGASQPGNFAAIAGNARIPLDSGQELANLQKDALGQIEQIVPQSRQEVVNQIGGVASQAQQRIAQAGQMIQDFAKLGQQRFNNEQDRLNYLQAAISALGEKYNLTPEEMKKAYDFFKNNTDILPGIPGMRNLSDQAMYHMGLFLEELGILPKGAAENYQTQRRTLDLGPSLTPYGNINDPNFAAVNSTPQGAPEAPPAPAGGPTASAASPAPAGGPTASAASPAPAGGPTAPEAPPAPAGGPTASAASPASTPGVDSGKGSRQEKAAPPVPGQKTPAVPPRR